MTLSDLMYKYPTLPKGTNIHVWPDRAFVKYRKMISAPAITWSINESASNILQLITGQNSIKDIIVKLAETYKVSENEIESMLTPFMLELNKRIPVIYEETPMKKDLLITGNNQYITPMHAAIELTYKCNLKCKHCYIESDFERKEAINFESAYKLLNVLHECGVSVIELTGGEPTLYNGFNELLIHATELFDLVGIVTNGTLLTKQILDTLSNNRRNVAVQIDLHGSDKEYIDWFTGGFGVFEREVNAIKEISNMGIILRVAMVVTPLSLSQMRKTATLAKELGATTFGLSPAVPQGRGSDDSLLFTEQELREYINIMNDLSLEFGDFIFHLEESPFTMAASQNHCGAGARSITITPSGEVKICQMSSADLLSFGNIFYDHPETLFGKESANRLSVVQPPNYDSCASCNNISFCFSCINRGLMMAKKLGSKECKWYRDLAYEFL